MSSINNSELIRNDQYDDQEYDDMEGVNGRKRGAKGPKRKHWLKEEDDAIVQLIQEFGTTKWTLISQMMKKRYNIGKRSAKQCRERWHNHLDPDIKKEPISHEEEIQIFKLHQKYGNKWAQISNEMPGRTDNAIKNQFHSILRKQVKKINTLLLSELFTEMFFATVEKGIKRFKEISIEDLSKFLKDGLVSYDDINLLYKESLEHIKAETVTALKERVQKDLEQKVESETINEQTNRRSSRRGRSRAQPQEAQVPDYDKIGFLTFMKVCQTFREDHKNDLYKYQTIELDQGLMSNSQSVIPKPGNKRVLKENAKEEEDKFMDELNFQIKTDEAITPVKNSGSEEIEKQESVQSKLNISPKKGSDEKIPKKTEKYVDPKLVPDGHKNLFRALKNDGSGSSDEDIKTKKIPTYEPQAIRPAKMPSKQFFGFKNTFKESDIQEHSNPHLMYQNYSIPPKFLFNNESDPQQMNVSNNSNMTHSYMFQNFDFNSLAGKNKVNLSRPTDFNMDLRNPSRPNLSNFTSNMMPKSESKPPVIEKDKNIQINLTVLGGQHLAPQNSNNRMIDLNKIAEPLNIATMRGKKITIEVQENGTLLINECDNMGIIKTNNTSNPREMNRSHPDDHLSPKMGPNSIFQNNKFGKYVKRVASTSDALNSNKSEAESIILPRVAGQLNSDQKGEEIKNYQPKFNFTATPFRNNQL